MRFLSDFDARRSSLGLNFFCFAFSKHLYSFRLKINAILRSSTQPNTRSKITNLPLVFCKKDVHIILSIIV